MSTGSKSKRFTSTSTPASISKILNRSLSRLKSRTPSVNITPISSSLKSVWLHDWWLVKAEGNGLTVSGFTFREGVGSVSFNSKPIVKRHYATILETKDGITVTISGFINRDRTCENGFSFQICDRFQLGFPYSWEELATQSCGEESPNRGSPDGKSGFDEPKISAGISANTASVSFDDLPVTTIHDVLMHPLGDSNDCALADMLGNFGRNDVRLSPTSTNPDITNPVTVTNTMLDETPGKIKRKADQKYKDGGKTPHRVDAAMGECIKPSRGVVTRSMSRSKDLREIREESTSSDSIVSPKAFRNYPKKVLLSSPIKSKDDAFFSTSTSEATKKLSGVTMSTSFGKDSCAIISRLMNLRKMNEENPSSKSTVSHDAFRNNLEKDLLHSSIKSEDNAFLSTSEATKNHSGGRISKSARKESWATTSSEKVTKKLYGVTMSTSSVKESSVFISRLMNLRKMKEENPPLNSTVYHKAFRNNPEKDLLHSSIKNEYNAFLSTVEATKNQSGGTTSASAKKHSWATTSSEEGTKKLPAVTMSTSSGKDSCAVISRLVNLRKMNEENPPSNSNISPKAFRNHPEKDSVPSLINCEDDAFLSTSEATKNQSSGTISTSDWKDSWATTSSERVTEVPDVYLVRRSSSRPNIRKDYRNLQE